MQFLLEQVWRVPFDAVTGAQVAAGELTLGDYDVFIVPGVTTADLNPARQQIASWIEEGGIYVGTARPGGSGGTQYAVMHGYTTATTSTPGRLQVPGTMFRVTVNRKSPLTLGAPRAAYWYHLGERVLSRSKSGVEAASFPKKRGFWFSGYAEGVGPLKGSAGLIDEKMGQGRVVLFSGEPNYRAYTEGVSFFLANALVYPTRTRTSGEDVSTSQWSDERRRAMLSSEPETGPGRPITIEVPRRYAAAARDVIERFTTAIDGVRMPRSALFRIPNPRGLDFETHPFAFRLLPALKAAGIPVLSAIL